MVPQPHVRPRTRLNAEKLEARVTPAFGDLLRTFTDPTPVPGGEFASSVAASGNIAVVGSINETVNGQGGAGAVHVYDLASGGLLRTIPNPDPAPDDDFGTVVALDGNILVVGVPNDDGAGGTSSGSAYVFDVTTGNLLHWLHDTAPQVLDNFGTSVAVSGNRVAVGNPKRQPQWFRRRWLGVRLRCD